MCNASRKNIRIQKAKAQPRHYLSQRAISGRLAERELLSKALVGDSTKPAVGFSVTCEWNNHKKPKRKPQDCKNEITKCLNPGVLIGRVISTPFRCPIERFLYSHVCSKRTFWTQYPSGVRERLFAFQPEKSVRRWPRHRVSTNNPKYLQKRLPAPGERFIRRLCLKLSEGRNFERRSIPGTLCMGVAWGIAIVPSKNVRHMNAGVKEASVML